MKIVEISLFLLCLNVGSFFIFNTGAFPNQTFQVDQSYWSQFTKEANTKLSEEQSLSNPLSDFVNAIGNYVASVAQFILIVANAPFAIGPLITYILGGSPTAQGIGGVFSIIVSFIYIVGIAQYRSNRSFKSLQ